MTELIYAHLVRRVFLTFGLLALLLLIGTRPLPASAASPSFVRIVDASPDVGIVAVFVDGAKFLENVQYGTVTDYLLLPAGSHKVQAALIGNGGSRAIEQMLSVQAGTAYTVAAIETKSTGFSLRVFVDNNLMAAGMAKVRFYDLSPQSYNLSIAAGINRLIAALSYPQASNYLRLRAGQYTFTARASQPPFTLMDQVTLKINTVTSIFIVGIFHGTPPLRFIEVQVKGLPGMAGTGTDPNAPPANASPFTPLAPGPLGVLALGGMSAGALTGLRSLIRQRTSRGRPPRLYLALLTTVVALAVTVAGLSLASIAASPAPAPFARLLVPAIGVNASIESIGVQPDGTMETPRQSPWNDVGWYSAGPRPGERGSAVIAGHLDRPGGNPAVFWRLRDLRVGDSVLVVDANGKTLRFHVTRIASYPPQDSPVQDIFGNTAGRFLNLTTCAGDWIPTQHQTALRLVVYTAAGPAPASPPPSSQPSSSPRPAASPPPSSSPTPAVTPRPTPRPSPTPAPPLLARLCNVSSTNLNFGQILQGQILTRQLTFGNCGGQTLNWSITVQTAGGGTWLSVSTGGGSIAPGNTATISVSASAVSLLLGSYSGTVTITSNGGNQAVSVEMTVIALLERFGAS